MLPEAAYKASTEKVGIQKISSVEPPRQESLTDNETHVEQSILAAISRLEGLNELKVKQNSRPPSDNSKMKKNDYRQERRKPPPAKPREKEE